MFSGLNEVVLVGQGLVSAYGVGVDCCVEGLLAGRVPFCPAGGRFAPSLAGWPVAAAEAVPAVARGGRVGELLEALFADAPESPPDAALYVATTVGEIGGLEIEVLEGLPPTGADRVTELGGQVARRLGLSVGAVQTVSSACASSTAALALAASAIRRGETSCAWVVGCDALSEFVLSGFASLMALDPDGAHPFDAARRGVTLGEAAAFGLLMSRERAVREGRAVLGVVAGWGMTCDANHLTGPSRDGVPLAEAAEAALAMAGCSPDAVTAVCAHGTGTVYNDTMEMLAFRRVFGGRARPTFSVKGGMGHTLGAAGVAQALVALAFLRRGVVPPTAGLRAVSADAAGWVSGAPCPLADGGVVLTTNSGFGGVNAALVLACAPVCSVAAGRPLRAERVAGACVCTAGGPAEAAFAAPKHFGRFSAEARLAFQALSRALDQAGAAPDGEGRVLRWRADGAVARVGVVVWDRDGSSAVNRAYFSDYAAGGRVLGRGQLFAYTLPTSVAAECAIACRLTGPLVYVAEADGGDGAARRAARGLLADRAAEAVALLTVTPEEARVTIVREA